MRSLFIGLILITGIISTSAQSRTDSCSIFENLKFKNDRDTIVVKAILRDFLLAPPRLILKKTPAIYKYKFGSYVSFQSENCTIKYNRPILSSGSVDKEHILYGNNLGATVYLTFVVFDEVNLDKGEYDCLIIRISREKPTGSK